MGKRNIRLWQLAGLAAVILSAKLYSGRKPKVLPKPPNKPERGKGV